MLTETRMNLSYGQSNYWDKVAHKKVFRHQVDWNFLINRINVDSKILDYGCGYGRVTSQFIKKGYENIIGVDSSSKMIELAVENVDRDKFLIQKDQKLAFKDSSFDVVLLFSVLTCIPIQSEQRLLISELTRCLSKGGMIYLSDLLINEDSRNLLRYEKSSYKRYGVFEHKEGVVFRHHYMSHFTDLFQDLNLVYEREFCVKTMNKNKSKAVQLIYVKS